MLKKHQELDKIKPLIMEKRMKMPRLGTRKLYHLLLDQFKTLGVKLGRDGLFSYLREEKMLIKPLKSLYQNHRFKALAEKAS